MSASFEPAPPSPDYRALVVNAVEVAERLGFDAQAALAADYGPGVAHPEYSAAQVQATAAEIAAAAELDPAFFDRPADTILLFAVAHDWLGTEARLHEPATTHERLAAERDALLDMVLLMAGRRSGVVRALAEHYPDEARRYMKIPDPEASAIQPWRQFLQEHNDEALAAGVAAILAAPGDRGILAEALAVLDVDSASYVPPTVIALRVAPSEIALRQAGFAPADSGAIPAVAPSQGIGAMCVAEQPVMTPEEAWQLVIQPLLAAYPAYVAHFGAVLGASYRDTNGKAVMILTAPVAYALIHWRDGTLAPGREAELFLRTVAHELYHTQKRLTAGEHHAFGRSIDERMAADVAGELHAYAELVVGLSDLSGAAGVNLLEHLRGAVKTDDPLSAFLCSAAPAIGLRTALLLLGLRPRHYEQRPDDSLFAVHLDYLQTSASPSKMDAVIRDVVRRHGDTALKQYVQRQIDAHGTGMIAATLRRVYRLPFLNAYLEQATE